jgi:hypothetical protein
MLDDSCMLTVHGEGVAAAVTGEKRGYCSTGRTVGELVSRGAIMAGAYSKWLRLQLAGREGSEAEDGGEEKTEKRAEGEGLVPERETKGWSFKSRGEGAVPVRRQCFGWFREQGKNDGDKEARGRGQRLPF